jgi:hypothetical protein
VAKAKYVPEELGTEVMAPAGHYTPLEEHFLAYDGGLLLYVVGRTCIDSSCCGVGDWEYVRVEGRVNQTNGASYEEHRLDIEIDTIDSDDEKNHIDQLLRAIHPGARIEFR